MTPSLSHAIVHDALLVGLALGEKRDFAVSCGLVDASGRDLGVLRHSDASWASADLALGKARLASNYGQPTLDLFERWQRERPLFGAAVASWGTQTRWYVCEGGAPVVDGNGRRLGAVGIAGCFPAAEDHAVAMELVAHIVGNLPLVR